jgi:hypothetical protein
MRGIRKSISRTLMLIAMALYPMDWQLEDMAKMFTQQEMMKEMLEQKVEPTKSKPKQKYAN